MLGRTWANGRVTHALWFVGDERVLVEVEGDGDTDLDCFIKNRRGEVLASDTDGTDYCVLALTPPETGHYTLEVRNLGTLYNAYVIRVN